MRGEEEREGRTPIREEHRRRERERRERRGERGIDGREDTTTDDEEEEEEERRHGRLTVDHAPDLADVPRGQVLVEGEGIVKH